MITWPLNLCILLIHRVGKISRLAFLVLILSSGRWSLYVLPRFQMQLVTSSQCIFILFLLASKEFSSSLTCACGHINLYVSIYWHCWLNLIAAARAMEELNFTPLNGKTIRIMYSHRDPSVRKSGAANIFIKVLTFVFSTFSLLHSFCIFVAPLTTD